MVIPLPVKPATLSTVLKPYMLKLWFTNKNVKAEVIHVPSSTVACSASTTEKLLRLDMEQTSQSGGDVRAAAMIGKILGERLLLMNIPDVHLDLINRHYSYNAKVNALINSMRNTGVKLL